MECLAAGEAAVQAVKEKGGPWQDKVSLGANAHATRVFRQSLRPEKGRLRARAGSAPPRTFDGGGANPLDRPITPADKIADRDGERRCGSFRYCNKHFNSTLRQWDDSHVDVATTTPKSWRISGGKGGKRMDSLSKKSYGFGCGHDISSNDAKGWQAASSICVDKHFQGALRGYEGEDLGDPFYQRRHMRRRSGMTPNKARHVSSGSIWREQVFTERVTSTLADYYFFGSLRSYPGPDDEEEEGREGLFGSSAARTAREHRPIW